MRRHYKKHSSGFKEWEQKAHAEDYMLFPNNIGEYLSIYEVSLSKGELYTFVTNKTGKSKQGIMVACIKGTRSEDIINVLEKLPLQVRRAVGEITLDMAKNIESAVRTVFPEATLVTVRFHVVKLAMESLQHLRVKERWVELDKENKAIEEAKQKEVKYRAIQLSNGDTPKQLLADQAILCFFIPESLNMGINIMQHYNDCSTSMSRQQLSLFLQPIFL